MNKYFLYYFLKRGVVLLEVTARGWVMDRVGFFHQDHNSTEGINGGYAESLRTFQRACTLFPVTLIVLGYMGNERDIIRLHFLSRGLSINVAD